MKRRPRDRRRSYRTAWECPECRLREFFEVIDSTGRRHRTCVDCFALDGIHVEPVRVIVTNSEPPDRTQRLVAATQSPLRTTRSK